jgi:hypothetical protein
MQTAALLATSWVVQLPGSGGKSHWRHLRLLLVGPQCRSAQAHHLSPGRKPGKLY